jgi:hypothetical protein
MSRLVVLARECGKTEYGPPVMDDRASLAPGDGYSYKEPLPTCTLVLSSFFFCLIILALSLYYSGFFFSSLRNLLLSNTTVVSLVVTCCLAPCLILGLVLRRFDDIPRARGIMSNTCQRRGSLSLVAHRTPLPGALPASSRYTLLRRLSLAT